MERVNARPRVAILNSELARILRSSTLGETTLEGATERLTNALSLFKAAQSLKRIGMVAGVRESDGPDKVKQNSIRLAEYTDVLRSSAQFPLFSCIDIYDSNFLFKFDRIESLEEWNGFWRRMFEPKLITDLYLTPRWTASKGVLYEQSLAKEFKVRMHLVDKNPALVRILRTR